MVPDDNRKKILAVVGIVFLLVSVAAALYLVQRTQVLKSKASQENIIFKKDGVPLPTGSDNLPVTDSLEVTVELNPPSI
ncbi:MAG: hypothetical protein Q7S88_00585 [Candidatus Daviesbacteria bacterium]|nr:hypothetical protein [Candidatus Daviesbacteria bacterium]